MREIQPRRVIEILVGSCWGRGNGVPVYELVELVVGRRSSAALEREMRSVVQVLRYSGYPICAYPGRGAGYYWATTTSEIDETLRFLRGRALTSLAQAGALRRLALPMLAGQLRLPLGVEPQLPAGALLDYRATLPTLLIDLDDRLAKRLEFWLEATGEADANRLICQILRDFLEKNYAPLS
jgi:hypothetical protein